MTTKPKERSVPADVLTPLPLAAALSHLRGAAVAVKRLVADLDPSDPICDRLSEAGQAIQVADQALTGCVPRSW
jgi:hypothetical protein